MRIIQVYALTSTYEDEDVERFYENVEVTLELHKCQYYFIIVTIVKIGEIQCSIDSNWKMRYRYFIEMIKMTCS